METKNDFEEFELIDGLNKVKFWVFMGVVLVMAVGLVCFSSYVGDSIYTMIAPPEVTQ